MLASLMRMRLFKKGICFFFLTSLVTFEGRDRDRLRGEIQSDGSGMVVLEKVGSISTTP